MSDKTRIQEAARFLCQEHQARKPFGPIPQPYAPDRIDEAYTVQAEFQKLLGEIYGPIAGYKIALTTPVMRRILGVNEPIAGAILAKTIHHSPTTVRRIDYVHLGIECEIAFQLSRELPAVRAPYSRDTVADAVGTAIAAFELIDDRNADYSTLAAQVLSLIADNAWNAGIVLGAPVANWRTVDLAAVRGTIRINGVVVGEGRGSDVMGHPLEALVWLANMFAKRGKDLSPGMTIMTGSIVAMKFVNPGDAVELSVDGLGEVSLRIT